MPSQNTFRSSGGYPVLSCTIYFISSIRNEDLKFITIGRLSLSSGELVLIIKLLLEYDIGISIIELSLNVLKLLISS